MSNNFYGGGYAGGQGDDPRMTPPPRAYGGGGGTGTPTAGDHPGQRGGSPAFSQQHARHTRDPDGSYPPHAHSEQARRGPGPSHLGSQARGGGGVEFRRERSDRYVIPPAHVAADRSGPAPSRGGGTPQHTPQGGTTATTHHRRYESATEGHRERLKKRHAHEGLDDADFLSSAWVAPDRPLVRRWPWLRRCAVMRFMYCPFPGPPRPSATREN